ncbi:MAG: cobyrinate a,c-diamide synthase [Eubacterium sp.]|nr:cobyrinate a,c-diamide synthase [Eubacterium sp.]
MNTFMLAGVSSNVGKTTVTMGIMAALCARHMAVVPFKTGPDYIDPMFHSFVTGRKSTNLDTWMLDEPTVRRLFYAKLQENSVGIAEGVMGLYDGHGVQSDVGSSAYLAKTLGVPVFLIIDGRGMSKSAAAMVKGYVDFDPEVTIAGVIINKISSESHYKLLKEMIETWAGVPCVGYFPNCPDIVVNSRHLGLIPVEELEGLKAQVAKAAELAEAHIDLDKILDLSKKAEIPALDPDPFEARAGEYSDLTIAYARDKAFSFYYEDNFNALRKLGVKLIPVSPLADTALPGNIDGLYIGGGFPEVFGAELAANAAFRNSVKEALAAGLPCFAECGGLMYLTRSMEMLDGAQTEAAGFFDAVTQMTKRLQRFGYVEVLADIDGKQIPIRAHEFHHSLVEANPEIKTCYAITKGRGSWRCGYTQSRTLAGYPHIHFYSNPEFLFTLLEVARRAKERPCAG